MYNSARLSAPSPSTQTPQTNELWLLNPLTTLHLKQNIYPNATVGHDMSLM